MRRRPGARRVPRARTPCLIRANGHRGSMHAGRRQRVADGGQAPVPWRLSRSVIDSVGPAGTEFARNADFVLAKARLTLRSSGAQNFRFWVLYVISHPRRWRRAGRPGRCGLSARLSAAMLWPIPQLLAGTLTTTSVLAVRSSGRSLLVRPRRLVVGLRHHRPSRTPISSGSRASRLTSVSGFHQVDSMGISDATFRQGLVGSTWPGGCAESLSSAWPAVSLVGAGA